MSVPLSNLEVEEDGKLSLLDGSDSDVETTKPLEAPKPRIDSLHDGLDRLQVPYDPFRPKSPDSLSRISVDHLSLPSARDASQTRWSAQGHAPRTFREKLNAFWQRNRGVALVLVSQVFGTLMNVTTRVLEIEGNHGKVSLTSSHIYLTAWLTGLQGMHPFQVDASGLCNRI